MAEFREQISPDKTVHIDGQDYGVKQVIRFRFDGGGEYFKCFLSNGFVLADDLDEDSFILVEEVKTPFEQPFPKKLEFGGRHFQFIYEAHAVAEETWGEEIFKKGESERFWDYQSDDGRYLSLGTLDKNGQRLDFYGRVVSGEELHLR